jgi:hypothetical protein
VDGTPLSSNVAARPHRRPADAPPVRLRARGAVASGDRFRMPEDRGFALP